MRSAFVLMAASAAVATGQSPELPPDRYGVRAEFTLYPQTTSRQAVASLAALIERKKFEYLTAQVLDPAVVDARVALRSSALLPGVEKQLEGVRSQQRLKPAGVDPEFRVPDDAKRFAELAREKADAIAFKEVVKDVQAQLGEYPENLAFFRKLAKDGDFADAATESVATVKTDPERKLFLKKDGARWVVEDRKADVEKKK